MDAGYVKDLVRGTLAVLVEDVRNRSNWLAALGSVRSSGLRTRFCTGYGMNLLPLTDEKPEIGNGYRLAIAITPERPEFW